MNLSVPLRIAMWSGPRNISTAMMRSWENRADTCVIDEPFYASYLARTGLQHPGREQVLASQPHDWREVVAGLTGPVPGNYAIFFQKHMTHHIGDDMPLQWLGQLQNCFLVRNPQRMLASLRRVLPAAQFSDTGLPQQLRLFETVVERTGQVPPVVDADDVLENPRGLLSALCEKLGVAFDEGMLSWPAGGRDSDGVWAPYWYHNVLLSTGFAAPDKTATDTQDLEQSGELLQRCQAVYETLSLHKLVAG